MSSTSTAGASGSSGSAGASGSSGSAGASGSSGSAGASGSSGSAGASGSSGSGTAGEACGMNGPCAPGSHCLFGDLACGTSPPNDVCPAEYCAVPSSCSGLGGPPACGCDGKIYDNACLADSAGVGTSILGNCGPAPQGRFACGDVFCEKAAQICVENVPDGCAFTRYECRDLPQGCGSASCNECVDASNECLDVLHCLADANGDITVTCATF
ncbi:hypothetical protein WMF45_00845 [Sorangium sp. So ce448]|uniref:hypothetical protein n=1 Tax=Sorangium sp. So ce448 TaxID=3133314 RepID=UPI003F63AA48